MQDTIQEWHAEDVILEHFGSIFGAFLEPKTTKIASKHAPQRRVYARSVQKGPIDDRAHARKMRFFERLVPESCQGFSSLSLHAMIRDGVGALPPPLFRLHPIPAAPVWVRGAVGAAGSPPLGRTSSGGAVYWNGMCPLGAAYWNGMAP
eukprot:gene12768-biopygen4966